MSKYFDPIRHLHTKELDPIKNRISLDRHLQIPMFDRSNRSHLNMGVFYELLSAALFGGELVDSIIEGEGHEEGYIGCKPDVENKRTKKFIESKAMRQGQQLNLLDDQISKYLELQISNTNYDIDYTIWRHGIKGVRSLDCSYREIIKILCEKTYAGLVFPFSLIDCFHKNAMEAFKRYEKVNYWPDCTRLGSKMINEFILDPDSALFKTVNGYKYTWRRYVTPSDLWIEGIQVRPFPIIVFKNKNNKWKRDLLNDVPF